MKAAHKFFSALCMLFLVAPALAQEPQPPQPAAAQPKPQRSDDEPGKDRPRKTKRDKQADSDSNDITSATVERIMEQAVRNIARTYNLSEEQEKLTGELMKTRVRSFLKEHESEVWPLIRELLTTQMGNNPPEDVEQVKRIGKAARPLARLAQEAILEGNREWRKHLTEEQKAIHDFDMNEMQSTFEQINKNFDAWAEGNPPPGGLFPQPTPVAKRPPPPQARPVGLPDARVEVVAVVKESFFDAFVTQFILENQLDPSQVTSAKSILTEFKDKYQDFRNAHKEELVKVAEAQRLAKEGKEQEKIAAADEARRQALQPAYQLFGEMEERLAALLTSVQLEKYKERKKQADPVVAQKAIEEEVIPAGQQAAPRPAPRTVDKAKPRKDEQSNN